MIPEVVGKVQIVEEEIKSMGCAEPELEGCEV